MKTMEIAYKDFFRYLAFDDKVTKEETKEISDLEGDGKYYAVKPDGSYTTIHHLVKKPKQEYVGVVLDLPSGQSVTKYVSPMHIFVSDGNSRFAKDCQGANIDTVYGKAICSDVFEAGEAELYDISIDSPHHYIDEFGIIHHNSFVGLKIAKNAQKKDEDWIVVYIDTEMAFDYDFSDSVGIDRDRLLVIQSNRIEEIQKQVMALTKEFTTEEREKVLLVIDSWGGLVTSKTYDDAMAGKDVKDMTIAQKKNSLARLITGLGMTIFVINQVYDCGVFHMQVQGKHGPLMLGEIKSGDEVLTTEGYQKVGKTFKYENTPTYEVEMEDGVKLEFTENHKFLVNHEGKNIWVGFTELKPGDDIVSFKEGDTVEIYEEEITLPEDINEKTNNETKKDN